MTESKTTELGINPEADAERDVTPLVKKFREDIKSETIVRDKDKLVYPLRIAYDFRDFDCAMNEDPKYPVYIIDSAEDVVTIFLKDVEFHKAKLIVETINAKS